MRKPNLLLNLVIPVLVVFSAVTPASAAYSLSQDTGYQTGFTAWRAADGSFSPGWSMSSVTINQAGALQLNPAADAVGTDPYSPGGYNGHNYYNGASFYVGEATSPEIEAKFGFKEAIVSWNADTPAGAWIEIQLRTRIASRWTKWYSMGIWASDTTTVERHSVNSQGDADGNVFVDTLVLADKKVLAEAFQLKARLFSAAITAIPTIRNLSVTYSTTPPKKASGIMPGNPADWGTLLNVPQCSQMVYVDGGNVWCSPTSTSMVLGYYGIMPGECAQRVRATVDGVYDWLFDGYGNWPFNTAFAASPGYEAYVVRFSSLVQVEPWIKAGVPVIMSIAWGKNDLTNAPVASSSGHLIVLVGFDVNGNAIVNDPAAAQDLQVRRTYLRNELEPLWLQSSGGAVYLIFPEQSPVPGF
jgi:hypothetical protein